MIENLSLQSGDLIFIAIPNKLYRRVALATGSRASHVGIVFFDETKGWLVAESTIPFSKYTPLDKFLHRSDQGWLQIRRLKGGLTKEQVKALKEACDARMGKLYHLGFRYESPRQFCSKLVYEVYRCAIGVQVGRLEQFGELLKNNPDVPLAFWRTWFFGFIPWLRLTVTPASQINSPVLEAVYELPMLKTNTQGSS